MPSTLPALCALAPKELDEPTDLGALHRSSSSCQMGMEKIEVSTGLVPTEPLLLSVLTMATWCVK